MIEIFVNANKKKILEDATKRWENVKNTNHVKDPEKILFPYFALRTYLEHSCEQDKTKRYIETSMKAFDIIDMARQYNGLVYRAFIREKIYPKSLQMHFDSKLELMDHKKSGGETWSAFLEDADALCWQMRIGGTVENTSLVLSMFKELDSIPDIRNIREKIRDLKDKYYSDAEQQKKLNVHDLVTTFQEWMNVDREHWT